MATLPRSMGEFHMSDMMAMVVLHLVDMMSMGELPMADLLAMVLLHMLDMLVLHLSDMLAMVVLHMLAMAISYMAVLPMKGTATAWGRGRLRRVPRRRPSWWVRPRATWCAPGRWRWRRGRPPAIGCLRGSADRCR